MEPLSLLFSVIALAVAGITVIVILANNALQKKAVRKAVGESEDSQKRVWTEYQSQQEANSEYMRQTIEHMKAGAEHMKSVEAKLDRVIELMERSQNQA